MMPLPIDCRQPCPTNKEFGGVDQAVSRALFIMAQRVVQTLFLLIRQMTGKLGVILPAELFGGQRFGQSLSERKVIAPPPTVQRDDHHKHCEDRERPADRPQLPIYLQSGFLHRNIG